MPNLLIADSGSTKTDWALLVNGGEVKYLTTPGINPFYQDSEEIKESISTIFASHLNLPIDSIYFYGAGCANPGKNVIVEQALQQLLSPGNIFVGSDLLGAARGLCQHSPGMVCILGTGSNSCYYDGKEIITNVSPLGYILGDEGSGASMGKKLIADILKNQLPKDVTLAFFETYHQTAGNILDFVYKQPFPNRYLAQYTTFLAQHLEVPELEDIVLKSYDEFVRRNLLQYEQVRTADINFTGSIAYIFKDQLLKILKAHNLQPGIILKSPLEKLLTYHQHII